MPLTLLYKGPESRGQCWQQAVKQAIPNAIWYTWPDIPEPKKVDAIITWTLPDDTFARFPNIKAIFSVGAGVDQFNPAQLPTSVKLIRLIDPSLTQQMQTYVLSSVLMLHRDHLLYRAQQSQKVWQPHNVSLPHECRVSILGLGELGRAVGALLASLGFTVNGWGRSKKQLQDITTFHGKAGLADMLSQTDMLVSLLPLTPETKGIINSDVFNQLPKGASLINAGRGEQVIEQDLLEALESGQIRYAVLDVFKDEPLSPDHQYWSHPNIHITPHIASVTRNDTAGQRLADNLLRWQQNQPMIGEVDKQRGY